jgi:hypothetical protein
LLDVCGSEPAWRGIVRIWNLLPVVSRCGMLELRPSSASSSGGTCAV